MDNIVAITEKPLQGELERFFKDRFRIFLIIYSFAEQTDDLEMPLLLYGEIKIQAIDFFIRNPDYLAYELLSIAARDTSKSTGIEKIVKKIYSNHEPEIRKLEMEKFFYGAYEDIDDIIAYLHSRQLIFHQSKKRINGTVAEKHYYITKLGQEKINECSSMKIAEWYFERCSIIRDYLGGATGSELKSRQYQVEEYSNTVYKDKIQEINELVKEKFLALYNKEL